MIPKIEKSRIRLRKFDILENPEDDRKVFFITPPELYPNLFLLRFPELVQKSRRKRWELAKHGKSSFLSFESNILSTEELETADEWAERFSQYVLLGLNENIDIVFSNELDFCLALDYNYVDGFPGTSTPYAAAKNQLKFHKNITAVDILSNGLSKALRELKLMFQVRNPVLSIVPSHVDKCSVPRKLAKAVSKEVSIPFIDHILHCDKQSLRFLPFSDKIAEWNRLYSDKNCIQLSDNVAGKTVFLIDDLYQSGTTLWSCAKHLKQAGAIAVIGLVCVKTFRDTDNQ